MRGGLYLVTEEADGFHWYPGPEFVPRQARVLARREEGRWMDDEEWRATRAAAAAETLEMSA